MDRKPETGTPVLVGNGERRIVMNKVKRKIVEIDEERCDGCGLCIPSCAEGAIQIVDGKARIVADKFCDALGACLGECPQDALRVIEREAEEFDEEAVEVHLKSVQQAQGKETPEPEGPSLPCGCPSTQVQSFETAQPSCPGSRVQQVTQGVSELTHWPIQIHLVPPTAPFLRNADLLVLADCVGVTYTRLHEDLIKGRAVMMGCPKLDDAQAYIDKFKEVFLQADLQRVTVALMEVPCCSGLLQIVEQAKKEAGVSTPVEQVVISVKGDRLAEGLGRTG